MVPVKGYLKKWNQQRINYWARKLQKRNSMQAKTEKVQSTIFVNLRKIFTILILSEFLRQNISRHRQFVYFCKDNRQHMLSKFSSYEFSVHSFSENLPLRLSLLSPLLYFSFTYLCYLRLCKKKQTNFIVMSLLVFVTTIHNQWNRIVILSCLTCFQDW